MSEAGNRPLLEAADLLILSLWIAICAVTPEFIWQGGRSALEHVNADVLATALLFGFILAFGIEPALERLRHLLERRGHSHAKGNAPEERRNLLPTASMGLLFAIVSICLHDSISAFLGGDEGSAAAHHLAFVNGLTTAIAWTMVPFAVTLAWVSANMAGQYWRWLSFTLAAFSPLLAAWLFSWTVQNWVTTELPTLAILAAGWPRRQTGVGERFFQRAAMSLCWIAPLWLAAAALFSFLANALGFESFVLYTPSDFWIDARFYLGWTAGLLIVPDLPMGDRAG